MHACDGAGMRGNHYISFRILSRKILRRQFKIDTKGQDPRRCGVYFLWKDDELVYIGSSKNILSRIVSHISKKKIKFNEATYIPFEFPWHLSVEAAYISAYMPKDNFRHSAHGIDRETINQMVEQFESRLQ